MLPSVNSSQETSWTELVWYCTRWFRSSVEVNSSTNHNLLAIHCVIILSFLHNVLSIGCCVLLINYEFLYSGTYVSKVWWSAICLGRYKSISAYNLFMISSLVPFPKFSFFLCCVLRLDCTSPFENQMAFLLVMSTSKTDLVKLFTNHDMLRDWELISFVLFPCLFFSFSLFRRILILLTLRNSSSPS